LFESKETGEKFVVGNCHLFWNPVFDYIKHAQAFHLYSKASEFLNKHGSDLPLILCGDFNSMPNRAAFYLLHGESIFQKKPQFLKTKQGAFYKMTDEAW